MEGIIFLGFWLGCSTLHTLFDLKLKPLLHTEEDPRHPEL